ncbi:MAG TPA: hypothetical protein VF457_19210 [Burkholderiaceae bacterium]
MNFQGPWRRLALAAAGFVLAAAMSGCVSAGHFVDGSLKDVEASQLKKTDPAHPVQLLFDFKTKGTDNTRATELLRSRVADQVKASSIFSEVSDKPVDGSGLLTIVVDNVPLTDNAASQGFATGLTFGLKGSSITDGYICTATYTAPGATQAVTKQVHHAIITTLGNSEEPKNAVKTDSTDAAVTLMLHQAVGNLLRDVSNDPNFK